MVAGPAAFKQIGTRPPRPDGFEKVTGQAKFGADVSAPGMLHGRILRSPHAHARIVDIDCSEAMGLKGVEAVVCRDDFPELEPTQVEHVVMPIDVVTMSRNVMARDKVLYHGHAVAAVAAATPAAAEAALNTIRVEYEVLTHVLDLDSALAADAPVIDDQLNTRGPDEALKPPSNVALHNVMSRGDVDKGWSQADVLIERTFTTPSVHQGYIEPHSCMVTPVRNNRFEIWCSTQGGFLVRAYTALILGLDVSEITVIPSEIGGGFGGKLLPYLEPVALRLSAIAGRPVKMTMTREEVFRATGPAPATRIRVKAGATHDGRITAMAARMEYEAGAFKGGSLHEGEMNIFSCYDVENLHVEGLEILVNKPNVAPYRAPGLPQALLACENVVDSLARRLDMDPVDLRLKNAADAGSTTLYGMKLGPIGLKQALLTARDHPHYKAALRPGEGRGLACSFYIGGGCQSSATLHLTESGKVIALVGTPDIGGSRASMALMVAEVLGVPASDVVPRVADTESVGFSDCTGGSRVTFATGMAVVEAAQKVRDELCKRAALIWDVDATRVNWADGGATCEGDETRHLTIAAIAAMAFKTGGQISSSISINASGSAPSCSVNIADVAVDVETGTTQVTRFTAIQDAGVAIHPDYVEGQYQGGAAQGIGWALNEEYVYDAQGRMTNPMFLDYRMPVASDLPMIDTVIVEVPNPHHPYGVRGVGETPICAPMAAVAIAVNRALDTCITRMPLTPSRVMEAILEKRRHA